MIGLEVNNYTQLKKQIHDLKAKLRQIRMSSDKSKSNMRFWKTQ